MTAFRHDTELERSFDALEKDLLREDGPQISTVRNYNFAILPYDPADEFSVRRKLDKLCRDLREGSWNVGFIKLNTLLLNRLKAEGPEFVEAMIQREKRLANAKDPWRGLRTLKERVVTLLEGPDGLARDVIAEISAILERNVDTGTETVIFLGRAGALYPFFRTSALRSIHPELPAEEAERRLPKALLEKLVSQVSAGFNGDVGVVPRQFLKKFVNILEILADDSDIDAHQLLGFKPEDPSPEEAAVLAGRKLDEPPPDDGFGGANVGI